MSFQRGLVGWREFIGGGLNSKDLNGRLLKP